MCAIENVVQAPATSSYHLLDGRSTYNSLNIRRQWRISLYRQNAITNATRQKRRWCAVIWMMIH